MRRKIIYLKRIGDLNEALLLKLQKDLSWFFKDFGYSVKIEKEPLEILENEYDSMRKQYDGGKILKRLIIHADLKKHFPLLGIIAYDIYSRTLNFVFGLAINPIQCRLYHPGVALISVARLMESFYLRKEDFGLESIRIFKEAIHELGHAFGLDHCKNECVMRFSNSLMDTDKKPAKYCNTCIKRINNFLSIIESVR
ncbi:MAG: archaemetzincin family Zn-dependent metalloprotease [Promethearchaeota archaeon]